MAPNKCSRYFFYVLYKEVVDTVTVIDNYTSRGAWVAQSLRLRPRLRSWSHFVGLSPASGSVLTAHSLDPALDSVSPSLSALPPLVLFLFPNNK